MAFDFLGTIPSFEDFEELEEFVKIEVKHIEKRVELDCGKEETS
jgi:hypothetical protein